MQLSNIPGKLVLPFANAGGKSTIPVASQIGITAGAASLTDGFPPLTRTPIAAGGVPPSGLDMNGILYEMSAIIRWANAGGGYPYDGTFAADTNVGGYPKGARIMRSDGTGYWFNTVENNVTDPESAGAAAAGWVPDFTTGAATVAMASSSVTLTPAQYGKPLIVITGTLTANLNLIFPNIAGKWTVINATTGSYTIVAKTAAGTGINMTPDFVGDVICDSSNIYSSIADIRSRLATLEFKTIDVNDYVTGGSGTSADPWTGWDTGITWAGHTQYDFLDGYYSYATSPNFAKDYLRLNTKKGTVIRHTGSGWAMTIDAGSAAQLIIGVDIKCRLESNAGATGGAYMRACVHSNFDFIFHEVPGICFEEISAVLNTNRLEYTALVVGQSFKPKCLLNSTRRGVGEDSNANTYYLIAENVQSYGVILDWCSTGTFISGTSETNIGGGIQISVNSNYNTFINLDFESNTGDDITCSGSFNNFIGTLATGTVTMNGKGNNITGGTYNAIADGGTGNTYSGVSYSNNGGAFTSVGTGIVKRSLRNVTSDTLDIDIYPAVESIKSGSGSVSAPNLTATTIFSANKTGRCEIVAYITSGDAANFTASATVLTEGGGAARIVANNGLSLTLTLSGLDIKVTQTSGGTQTVAYKYIWIF